jgi:hypothetical protein
MTNRRSYVNRDQVGWTATKYNYCNQKLINYCLKADSTVFTASRATSATYDAYEDDIAYVTFYFEESTAFEYTRDKGF